MRKLQWIVCSMVVMLPAAIAAACPMCKDSIPGGEGELAGSLPSGFNFSVYYMLFGFLFTLGLCAHVLTKGARNTNLRMPPPDDSGK